MIHEIEFNYLANYVESSRRVYHNYQCVSFGKMEMYKCDDKNQIDQIEEIVEYGISKFVVSKI
jgi:hypothetical protein